MSETTITNSLARASSAYLRSAMHQPIRWHEWGEEAFATAQRENKPVLLESGIKDVAFGANVKVVQPANLYGCAIGDDCFIGPFVEIQKDVTFRRFR